MRVGFLDERREFIRALSGKLGGEFDFHVLDHSALESLGKLDVALIALPAREHPAFRNQLDGIRRAAATDGAPPIVAFLRLPERELAQQAISHGAYDYFVETSSLEELRIVLRRAAQFAEVQRELLRLRTAACSTSLPTLIASDPGMRNICNFAGKIAGTDATILIMGETGTGKELLASAIHNASARASEPFVAVACSSLPEPLIEAELFGHQKGAFTGAVSCRPGRFEAAQNGTIFLDEIGELSPAIQVKLLRVLQSRSFERLGSNQPRPMLARVICATNRNLAEMVKAGAFRADLYYRLNVVEITLPPLRDRRGDVPVLAHTFLRTYAERHRRSAHRISSVVLLALEEYDWPGNVRELQNVIERAVVVCDGDELTLEHLPPYLLGGRPAPLVAGSFDDAVRDFKRRVIQRALTESGNNKLQAARNLGIARSSLHRLLHELQIADYDSALSAVVTPIDIDRKPHPVRPRDTGMRAVS